MELSPNQLREIEEYQEQARSGTGKRGQATRPMETLHKHPSVVELMKRSGGQVTDLSGKHTVTLNWDLNDAAKRDKIFKLTIDEKVVYLDLEELTFYTRVMFK